ncbi:hypothetical protein [Psychroserpens mesophilus]|uniref:hypothetical protein n=1 Tax=Psychroserpens mesophilus TaxID=325473 RepID=UPI003D650B2E
MKKLNFIFSLLALCFLLNCDSDSSSDDADDPNNCTEANLLLTQAQADFTDANQLNYTSRCNSYKAALENVKLVCGDDTGEIQLLINNLGDCTQNTNPSTQALMTANLNGEQFNDLKPNGFNLFNRAINIVTFSYANDDDYISIQGNSTYQNVIPNNLTKEITIYIPQSSWSIGTYNLAEGPVYSDNNVTPTPHYDLVYFDNDDYSGNIEEEGSITITEFDLNERIIRGTFEFSYSRTSDTDVIGPFDCTNGTFEYSLDDDYFD